MNGMASVNSTRPCRAGGSGRFTQHHLVDRLLGGLSVMAAGFELHERCCRLSSRAELGEELKALETMRECAGFSPQRPFARRHPQG